MKFLKFTFENSEENLKQENLLFQYQLHEFSIKSIQLTTFPHGLRDVFHNECAQMADKLLEYTISVSAPSYNYLTFSILNYKANIELYKNLHFLNKTKPNRVFRYLRDDFSVYEKLYFEYGIIPTRWMMDAYFYKILKESKIESLSIENVLIVYEKLVETLDKTIELSEKANKCKKLANVFEYVYKCQTIYMYVRGGFNRIMSLMKNMPRNTQAEFSIELQAVEEFRVWTMELINGFFDVFLIRLLRGFEKTKTATELRDLIKRNFFSLKGNFRIIPDCFSNTLLEGIDEIREWSSSIENNLDQTFNFLYFYIKLLYYSSFEDIIFVEANLNTYLFKDSRITIRTENIISSKKMDLINFPKVYSNNIEDAIEMTQYFLGMTVRLNNHFESAYLQLILYDIFKEKNLKQKMEESQNHIESLLTNGSLSKENASFIDRVKEE